MKTKTFTIGEVARQAEVGVETVRYYEREGLLEQAARKASGYRQFDDAVVSRLRFIKRAKELGFTLKEIKELLELKLTPGSKCVQVKQRAEAKVLDIEQKIRTLQRMKKGLKKLTASCSGQGTLSECPILEALEDEINGND